MYGLVNKAVRDLVVSRWDEATWERIRQRAGVAELSFVAMRPYPDQITYDLVAAASAELNVPSSTVLEVFGEYWMSFTAREGYGVLLELMGGTYQEFLSNLNHMHARLRTTFPSLKPPRIEISERIGDTMRVDYFSTRQGLTSFVVGLLRGLGAVYRVTAEVTVEHSCADGHDHDVFRVRLRPADSP